MNWWRQRAANPNTRRRTMQTYVGKTADEHLREGEELRQYGAMLDANALTSGLAQDDSDRQRKKYLERLQVVARIVNASRDKRRRPRGVTKQEFKDVRRLKLTRTARVRVRKK